MENSQLDFNQPFLSVRRSPAGAFKKVVKRKTGGSILVVPQIPSYRSVPRSGSLRRPGTVPFQWEQTPGLPKEVTKEMTLHCDRPPIAPKLPPGRSLQVIPQDSHQAAPKAGETAIQTEGIGFDSLNDLFLDDDTKDYESCEEMMEKRVNSDSDDSDEGYVDAPDTLSRNEFFFINCSVSGLSGCENQDLKSSERFFIDPQTRELMMDRFLHATKAMTLETPQYAYKKESVVLEQPTQSKKMFTSDKPMLRYGPSFAKRWSYCPEKEKENEEESGDDYDLRQDLPAVCGLLPRFCTKSLLCLLNPLPTMSRRTQFPKSLGNTIQSRSSSACSFSENDNKSKSDIYELKLVDRVQAAALDMNLSSSRNECSQLANSGTLACLPFVEEAEVPGILEETKRLEKTFQELLVDESTDLDEWDIRMPAHEKTLYIDTMKKVGTQNLSSCLVFQNNHDILGSGEEEEMRLKDKIGKKQLVGDSLEETMPLHTPDGVESMSNGHKSSIDLKILSAFEQVNPKQGIAVSKTYGVNQNINYSTITTSVVVAGVTENQPPETSTMENFNPNDSHFPIPPSLPKSPSDSWLGRTLPYIAAKKMHFHSHLGEVPNLQNIGSKVPAVDIKCVTIGDDVMLQQDSMHRSKEHLMTIPEAEELHS